MTQRGALARFFPPPLSLPTRGRRTSFVPIVRARLARRDVDRRRPLVDERGHTPAAVDVPGGSFADQFAQHLACAEPRTFTNAGDHGVSLRASATPLSARPTAPSLVPFRQTFELRAASPAPTGQRSALLLAHVPRSNRARFTRPRLESCVRNRRPVMAVKRQPVMAITAGKIAGR